MHFPWETQVNVKNVAERLKKAAEFLNWYAQCSPYVAVLFQDKSRVKKIHDKLIGASAYIDTGGKYYGWVQEIKQLCEALEVLGKRQTVNDQMATAGAFGRVLLAASAIVGKVPFGGNAYGQVLEAFGKNFEVIYKKLLPAGFTDDQYQELWKNPQNTHGNG